MAFEREQNRRREDRRDGRERRAYRSLKGSWHLTQWVDIKLQFETRYLMTIAGIVLFNWVYQAAPSFVSLNQMNLFFGLYFVWISFTYFLVYRDQDKAWKARLTMWADILGIAFVVINDPSPVPPTALVWILIVMGNGMRFGMSMFREALAVCFIVAAAILTIKAYGASYESVAGISVQAIFGAAIIVYAYVLTSRIDRTHREVERISRLDPLTSLLNRISFIEVAENMLAKVCQHDSKLTLMFIDIDKFKSINDSMGHAKGDKVLCELSHILKHNIRCSDAAARFGGDEFVLILNDTSIDIAAQVASRIQQETTKWVAASDFDLSLSIGVGEAPTHGDCLDELLLMVDRAMYETKFATAQGGVAYARDH
ncbi:MAG: GGDEF domain-containing protein [Gammaproteobacteria bacterium]|nr:GGDEF domain-containing protein [Gammaproteobacteria bacterium]